MQNSSVSHILVGGTFLSSQLASGQNRWRQHFPFFSLPIPAHSTSLSLRLVDSPNMPSSLSHGDQMRSAAATMPPIPSRGSAVHSECHDMTTRVCSLPLPPQFYSILDGDEDMLFMHVDNPGGIRGRGGRQNPKQNLARCALLMHLGKIA